jgi:exosortase B
LSINGDGGAADVARIASLKEHAMQGVSGILERRSAISDQRFAFCVVGLAWAILYFPTYWSLANNLWWREEQSYGPIILCAAAWLFWQDQKTFDSQTGRGSPLLGFSVFGLGLFFFTTGRALDVIIFEVGSQIPVVIGLLLILFGPKSVRLAWLPIALLMFMVPLPSDLVATVTGPLKSAVSTVATQVLYLLNYPIARTGVILTVGQYQLLVADACSGLTSMFTLEALGLIYIKIMGYTSGLRRSLIVLLLIPVAFIANVVRVCILVLITYHLGDEAGRGFMHGFAGLVLFVVATLLMIAVDSVLGWILPTRSTSTLKHSIQNQ